MGTRWRAISLCLGLIALSDPARHAIAQSVGSPIACFDDQPSGRTVSNKPGRNFGPCTSPDTVAYFPAIGDRPGITVSNFGLVWPGGDAFDYICDDVYDRQVGKQIRRSPTGTFFIPNILGLLKTDDGCAYTRATGAIADVQTRDVAFDLHDPLKVYAIGGTPRILWRSNDGGSSFMPIYTFSADFLIDRVALPPNRTNEVYVFGYGRGISSPFWVSRDDGSTFVMHDAVKGAATPLGSTLDFLAFDPVDPAVIYFNVVKNAGDEIWRSVDGGLTSERLTQLQLGDATTGLAFGATPQTIYVAGKAFFLEVGSPPGRLYISRNAGKTWLDPIPSSPEGPYFNCLTAADGKLYACGSNRGGKTDAMLSVSLDEGATWQTAVRLSDLTGPKSCVVDMCQSVARWLCDNYDSCAEEPPAAESRDAGVPDGADAHGEGGAEGGDDVADAGCGCRLGGTGGPTTSNPSFGSGLATIAALAAIAIRRRTRRRDVRP